MFRLSSTYRIALCLATMALNVMLVAHALELFPDQQRVELQGRATLCEAVAIGCSLQVARGDFRGVDQMLNGLLVRNDSILSAAVRDRGGQIVVQVGTHENHWHVNGQAGADSTNVLVPIISANRPWGALEVAFRRVPSAMFLGIEISSFLQFAIVVTCLNSLVFVLVLRRFLRQLDPSRAVPDRVRSTLDTLAEGILVLDADGRIVLANDAFSRTIGWEETHLHGRSAAELPWGHTESGELPWQKTLGDQQQQVGVTLTLQLGENERRTFMVNSAPILDDRGQVRGVLASFDDITPLEKKKAELLDMLTALKRSREEIQRQNEQLRIMATQDPLTGCLNRRAFFERAAQIWDGPETARTSLSCIMLDVDHFKSINDQYGHSRGDEVLRAVAAAALQVVGRAGLVCRFGGEEFAVLLTQHELTAGQMMADRLRRAIEELNFDNLRVTASLGVSSAAFGAGTPQQLLDQADKALYVAKRAGRNQVVRWDEVPDDVNFDEQIPRGERPVDDEPSSSSIPFHAVTALMSALSFRDDETAAHSARVADLCVTAARGLMTFSEMHILEIAALLHDIGKIGVPDAILLKPGKLTEEEWRVMRLHDRIGVEIVNAAFACAPLLDIIATHHARFAGDPESPFLPTGSDIPLGARILTIADSFDAMVSDRVYREGRSMEEAFAELRRCAGQQFDPELVEHFIASIQQRSAQDTALARDASRQTGLHLGLQIDRLAEAIDKQDLAALSTLASRLESVAGKHQLTEIQEIARKLRELAGEGGDLTEIVRLTIDLMELSRSTQSQRPRADLREGNDMRRRLVHAGTVAAPAGQDGPTVLDGPPGCGTSAGANG